MVFMDNAAASNSVEVADRIVVVVYITEKFVANRQYLKEQGVFRVIFFDAVSVTAWHAQ